METESSEWPHKLHEHESPNAHAFTLGSTHVQVFSELTPWLLIETVIVLSLILDHESCWTEGLSHPAHAGKGRLVRKLQPMGVR